MKYSDDEIARRYSSIENYPSVNKAAIREIIYFLAEEISRNTYLNIMAQYHPCHKSFQFPLLDRPVTREEFLEAVNMAPRQGPKSLDRVSPPTARAMFL